VHYPGSGTFAELVHFNLTAAGAGGVHGTASISTVSGPDITVPHFLGFLAEDPSEPDSWTFKHKTPTNITAGCDHSNGGGGGGWPCNVGDRGTIRTRFAFGGTPAADVALYGLSNGLVPPAAKTASRAGVPASVAEDALTPTPGAGPLPPLGTRLPGPKLQQLGRALFYKLDAAEAGMPFAEYAGMLYPLFPVPGLVHFVGFEHIGFDNWYPDYLPPNAKFGTGCELRDAFAAAQARHHFAMPYTNPTWWDMRAPTLANLSHHGLTLRDVTCLNASRETVFEVYNPANPAGAVTELAHPFIVERWVRLMDQFTGGGDTAASAAADDSSGGPGAAATLRGAGAACDEAAVQMRSDFIFEDQLGARGADSDFNPRQRGRGAAGFQQALVDHARNFSAHGLGTEQGFDKIARHELSFYGHAIEMELGRGDRPYPFGHARSGWSLHPLSQALFGTSTTYNVHNLADEAFASRLNNTCWVLASGARLSVNGASARLWAARNQTPWYRSVGVMQRVAVSRWFGFAQVGFDRDAAANVSTTVMEASWDAASPPIYPGGSQRYHIVASWTPEDGRAASSTAVALPSLSYGLPAGGCAAFGSEDDLVAGWFTRFNNRTLPPDPAGAAYHAIVEDRQCADPLPPVTPSSGGGGGDGGERAMPGTVVCLHHPMGVDTPLDVRAPEKCLASDTTVTAVDRAGGAIARVPAAASGDGLVTFTAAGVVGTTSVDYFVLRCDARAASELDYR